MLLLFACETCGTGVTATFYGVLERRYACSFSKCGRVQFVAVGALHVRPIHVRRNSSDGAFCPICTIVPSYNLFKRICHSQVLLYSALLLPLWSSIIPIPLLHLFHFRHHHLKRFVVHHHHHHGCHSLQTNSNSRLPVRLCSPICNSCTFRWLPLTK